MGVDPSNKLEAEKHWTFLRLEVYDGMHYLSNAMQSMAWNSSLLHQPRGEIE